EGGGRANGISLRAVEETARVARLCAERRYLLCLVDEILDLRSQAAVGQDLNGLPCERIREGETRVAIVGLGERSPCPIDRLVVLTAEREDMSEVPLGNGGVRLEVDQ